MTPDCRETFSLGSYDLVMSFFKRMEAREVVVQQIWAPVTLCSHLCRCRWWDMRRLIFVMLHLQRYFIHTVLFEQQDSQQGPRYHKQIWGEKTEQWGGMEDTRGTVKYLMSGQTSWGIGVSWGWWALLHLAVESGNRTGGWAWPHGHGSLKQLVRQGGQTARCKKSLGKCAAVTALVPVCWALLGKSPHPRASISPVAEVTIPTLWGTPGSLGTRFSMTMLV